MPVAKVYNIHSTLVSLSVGVRCLFRMAAAMNGSRGENNDQTLSIRLAMMARRTEWSTEKMGWKERMRPFPAYLVCFCLPQRALARRRSSASKGCKNEWIFTSTDSLLVCMSAGNVARGGTIVKWWAKFGTEKMKVVIPRKVILSSHCVVHF